jgi:glutamate synthase (NADPH/NADH) small chain
MGKIGGFKEYDRTDESNIVITERVSNYNEFTIPLKIKLKNKDQGAWTVEFVLP